MEIKSGIINACEPASFYRVEKDMVVCELCNHKCSISIGKRGLCNVRENRQQTLFSLNYGEVVAEYVDPVEKKPLYHFLPGTSTYSVATQGCNFRCLHCQNHSISQVKASESVAGRQRTPAQLIKAALRTGCQSISYTYVEPTVFYEFAFDCCYLANKNNLKNCFVSNGYMSRGAARKISPYLDAINIDIKGFSELFYHKVVGAKLAPVLEMVQFMMELGVWVEITTLIIPGLNDDRNELRELAQFIFSLSPTIPWHISAFYPAYKLTDVLPTTPEALFPIRDIGKQVGLEHVYLGNIGGHREHTRCPRCGGVLIERSGYSVTGINMQHPGICSNCGYHLPGVWR